MDYFGPPPSPSHSVSSSDSSLLPTTPPDRDNLHDRQPRSILRRPATPGPYTTRPLPFVPHKLLCKVCNAAITNRSLACAKPDVKFRGFAGSAELFSEVYNTTISPPRVVLMATGAHTMQAIACSSCEAALGWKIVRAYHRSERWKEGRWLLEMESLYERTAPALPPSYDSLIHSHSSSPSYSSSSSSSPSLSLEASPLMPLLPPLPPHPAYRHSQTRPVSISKSAPIAVPAVPSTVPKNTAPNVDHNEHNGSNGSSNGNSQRSHHGHQRSRSRSFTSRTSASYTLLPDHDRFLYIPPP